MIIETTASLTLKVVAGYSRCLASDQDDVIRLFFSRLEFLHVRIPAFKKERFQYF